MKKEYPAHNRCESEQGREFQADLAHNEGQNEQGGVKIEYPAHNRCESEQGREFQADLAHYTSYRGSFLMR